MGNGLRNPVEGNQEVPHVIVRCGKLRLLPEGLGVVGECRVAFSLARQRVGEIELCGGVLGLEGKSLGEKLYGRVRMPK